MVKILTLFTTILMASTAAVAQQDAPRCVQVTWFDSAVAQKEVRVKGLLYPSENRLIYDWKNGAMEFIWTLPEGMKSGDPDGFEGTWQQDDGRGSFAVKENRKTAVFEGKWKRQGRKGSGRLSIEYCRQ